MIKLDEVCFKYRNTKDISLDNINLEIKKGEFILICGSSGSGKASITRLINELIPYYYEGDLNGDVEINDRLLSNYQIFELSKSVGNVFQDPRTQFFNVDTNSKIIFALENQGIEREILEKKLDETYNKLEVNKLKNRNIFHLSGGEKQKIAFTSVCATNPDIYLLDEPSSNLDVPTIDILKKRLSMLKESGKTVIISEHRIYYIIDLVDGVIYMRNGKIDKIFSNKDFLSLSEDEIKTMGLRAGNKPGLNMKGKSPIIDKSYLQVNNVSIYRKDKYLIDRFGFSANKGDIIAVLGSNGIGKTTFLRTLCGLYTDYKDEFILKSKEVDEKTRKQISYMVMQDVNYQLFADSVFAECKLGIKNVEDDLINELLNDFDLYNYKDSHPSTLSGGQKQRLAIVYGLLCNKKIFILGEPTSGLDYKNMIKTVELLKSHSGDKIIFIAAHNFEFASLICNRVLDLEKIRYV